MPLAVEGLTENSGIKEILEAIWKSTETMANEYRLDGKIGDVIPNNSQAAWSYASYEAYRIARQKTGKALPYR